MNKNPLEITTLHEVLTLDPATGALISCRSKFAPDQEFIAPSPQHPTFIIQYLDEERQYQVLTSRQTASVTTRTETENGATLLTATFHQVGELDLEVTTRLRAVRSEPLSRWTITVDNQAGIQIVDVQYPMLVCPYQLAGKPESEKLLQPTWIGELIPAPDMARLGPD